MFYDKEKNTEASESEAFQAVSASGFEGNIAEYLENVQSGKFGEHCQVGCNIYWTSDASFDPENN